MQSSHHGIVFFFAHKQSVGKWDDRVGWWHPGHAQGMPHDMTPWSDDIIFPDLHAPILAVCGERAPSEDQESASESAPPGRTA